MLSKPMPARMPTLVEYEPPYAPKIFGLEHIIFLILFAAIAVCLVSFGKKFIKTQEQKDLYIRVMAGILLLAIIFNRISISVFTKAPEQLIPETYCGLTSLVIALAALLIKNRNHAVFHFLVYIALIGSLCNNIYPTYIGQAGSFFHSRTISGMLHHSFAIYLVMLLFLYGGFRPSMKMWYCMPIGFCIYITYGLFCLQILKSSNPMNINYPILSSTPLKWHLMGVLYLVAVYAISIPFDLTAKKRSTTSAQWEVSGHCAR